MRIQDYTAQFRDLRPNRSGGRASPHKASLLLAVMDLIEKNAITQNRIEFNATLKAAFSDRFKRYAQGADKDDPAQPFFYLTSSSFWQVEARPGAEQELNERLQNRRHGSARIVERLISHAHINPDLFEYMQHDVHRATLSAELETTLTTLAEAFKAWCESIGKSPESIARYIELLSARLPDWETREVNDAQFVREAPANYWPTSNVLADEAMQLYSRFLEEQFHSTLEQDILELDNRTLDTTVRSTLVNARRGQGIFRKRVLAQGNNRCAVTGYRDERFLLASHIKPWRACNDSERLDRFNGLLLTPALDRAFDIGFITFNQAGQIRLSPHLNLPEKLGISLDQSIDIEPTHNRYLEYHRDVIFVSA